MENKDLNIPQQSNQSTQSKQPSFNDMDSQRNYKQNKSSVEPKNPFIFSGTPNDNEDSDQPVENVKQVGSITQVEPVKDICFISIIGEIEGHSSLPPQSKTTKYEHIIPLIIGAEMDPEIKGVLILINTMGGDVEAGLAISELVASISKPTVSIVLGGGHSIGGFSRIFFHSTHRNNDNSSYTYKRACYRSASNIQIFPKNAGEDY